MSGTSVCVKFKIRSSYRDHRVKWIWYDPRFFPQDRKLKHAQEIRSRNLTWPRTVCHRVSIVCTLFLPRAAESWRLPSDWLTSLLQENNILNCNTSTVPYLSMFNKGVRKCFCRPHRMNNSCQICWFSSYPCAYVDKLQRTLHGVVPTNLHERWKRA